MRLRGPVPMERRAQWMHDSGVLVLRGLRIGLQVTGEPPARGLLVANHLSYLDIAVFSAAAPCYLVSKAEISRWPFFGVLARAGGTIFVDRSSRASAEEVSGEIAERLRGEMPVLFFPEGTSTDGSHLLRFHSRFYVPAVETGAPVTAAAVRYIAEDGTAERAICWFGDDAFLPHLWKMLGSSDLSVELQFGSPRVYTDRRTAVQATYAEIEQMRRGSQRRLPQ